YLSSLPRDRNHPYGHGKVEFISASIEGALIAFAGVVIIYESIQSLRKPHTIHSIDFGIYLIAFTAIANYFLGYLAVKKGKKNNLELLLNEMSKNYSKYYKLFLLLFSVYFCFCFFFFYFFFLFLIFFLTMFM